MPSPRSVVLANDQVYHVFNRGIERRTIFTKKREYQRMTDTLWYYHHAHVPMTLSAYYALPQTAKETMTARLNSDTRNSVSILAYCLMPNHFHLLIRQHIDLGIQKFMANIQNSYTKYFNTKYKRVGPLLQGIFKAVWIESDEQLLHVSRYIHLNPVASFLVSEAQILDYPWSSLPEYENRHDGGVCETTTILGMIKTRTAYRTFVCDQVGYAKTLGKIKYITIDGDLR
ncbi:transposase [Candidatus Gottesmanbacteria bacterium]|nr:transposase [Candidatus Gottesmanbacteria bacterium]